MMRTETRTITIFDSVEEYVKVTGFCPLCDQKLPHGEEGCPTFQESED